MVLLSFTALRFYFLLALRTQPVALGAVMLSMACLASAALLLVQQQGLLRANQNELTRLNSQPLPPKSPDSLAAAAVPTLPAFASAPFVAALGDAASDAGVPLGEVRFALDESAGMPYLRYRATLGVTAGYPLVRKMAERIQATMPNVAIDGIHCARKSPLIAELSCELALSGLFRKVAAHG